LASQNGRQMRGFRHLLCPYCAHTVPTIFTLDRREPLVEDASSQVRGTLSSMTIDDLPAGIIPGLQTSPSATQPLTCARAAEVGSATTRARFVHKDSGELLERAAPQIEGQLAGIRWPPASEARRRRTGRGRGCTICTGRLDPPCGGPSWAGICAAATIVCAV
jgi:hypothetical protein